MKRWKNGNALDVCILLLILLCVVSGGARVWEQKREEKDTDASAYTVTFIVEEIPAERAACLAAGDALYSERGEFFGTVSEILYTPTVFHLLSNGAYYEGVYEVSQVCNMTLRTEVTGRWEAGGAVCGSLRLIPGGTVKLRSLRGDWELWILSVTEVLK
jgi:hypothetical protein